MHARRRKVAAVFSAITILALLVPGVGFADDEVPIIDVSWDVVTVDSGEFGGYWAYDYLSTFATVWPAEEGGYMVFVSQVGTFESWAGTSPGNTGTIGDGVTGEVVGGFVAWVDGDPDDEIDGYLGLYDYGCDQNADCPNFVSWRDILFEEYGDWEYLWWGWFYTTCGNGYWYNTADGNEGDITGDFVACPEPEVAPEPVVRNLWAYINPAAEVGAGNICYILSNGQPIQHTEPEKENAVRRLCYPESAPDWWQGAFPLTHGDVFENGTDWGFWEGDAIARAFSSAKRLPLHADGPNNDLLDRAEMFPWTQ